MARPVVLASGTADVVLRWYADELEADDHNPTLRVCAHEVVVEIPGDLAERLLPDARAAHRALWTGEDVSQYITHERRLGVVEPIGE